MIEKIQLYATKCIMTKPGTFFTKARFEYITVPLEKLSLTEEGREILKIQNKLNEIIDYLNKQEK